MGVPGGAGRVDGWRIRIKIERFSEISQQGRNNWYNQDKRPQKARKCEMELNLLKLFFFPTSYHPPNRHPRIFESLHFYLINIFFLTRYKN